MKQNSHDNSTFDNNSNLAKFSSAELREIIARLAQAQNEYTTVLEGYRSEKQELKNQLFQSNHIIGKIYASKSWRITFPIRWTSLKIKLLLRKIQNGTKIFRKQGVKAFLLKMPNPLQIQEKPSLEYFGDLKDIKPDRETILVVSHEASRTGAPILALNIIQALNKKYNVVAMLLGQGTMENDFRKAATIVIKPLQYGNRDPYLVSIILMQFLNLCKIKFAIVNSIESRAALPQLAKCFVPTIALIHEFASYIRPLSALGDAIFWTYQSIFSANIVWENAVAANSDIGNKPAIIIPQGQCKLSLEQDAQSIAQEKAKIICALRPEHLPLNTLIIIGLGSVNLRKGVDLFIECAARVLNTTKVDCRFVWIGHGYNPEHDASYSVYLAHQIKRANLEKYITFLDETPQLEFIYQQADILLLSSRLDPLPNVAIDAIAHGLPLVCFDKTTGIADILHIHGLSDECIANYLDTNDLAAKVRNLTESPEQRNRISNRFKEIAIQLFNMETYVSQIEDIALRGVLDTQKECEDTLYISSLNILDLNFFLPPQWPKGDTETYARYFVRGLASGINMRKPCPGFHPGIYMEEQWDSVKNSNPYVHFLKSGRPIGPWVSEVISPSDQTRKLTSFKRIAIHIHVHYADLIEQIIENLVTNEVRPDLLISVSSSTVMDEVKNIVHEYNGKIADIKLVPNRGRNIRYHC